MKLLNLLLVATASLSLFACNAGDDGNSDVQNINLSSNSGLIHYNISGNAVNCRTSPNNCQVNISYTYPNNTTLAYIIGTQSAVPTNCTVSNNVGSCTFSINSQVVQATNVTFKLTNGANNVPTATAFIIGGGL